MKEVLFDLWNGNLCLYKENKVWEDERDEILGYIENQTQELSERINDKNIKTLEKIHANYIELRSLEREAAFVKGFSIAVKLLFEAFND